MGNEFIEDAFLYEEAGAGAADLALVEEDAFASAVDGLRKVAVIEYDIRRLAAQLQCAGDELVASGLVYAVAHFGGAGECQLVQIRMVQEPLAGLGALAGDHIHHALRKYISDEADEFHEREGGVRRRLHDDRISCSQSRSELPASHGEWEIPGNDLSHHAYRFVENEGHGVVVDHGSAAFPSAQATGEVTEVVTAQRHIGSHGLADRFAIVQGFAKSQMLGVCVNDVGDFEENILSFDGRGLRPSGKRRASCLHGSVYIFLRRFGKERQRFAIGRIVTGESRAVRSRRESTIDEKTILLLNVCVCHKKYLPFQCAPKRSLYQTTIRMRTIGR